MKHSKGTLYVPPFTLVDLWVTASDWTTWWSEFEDQEHLRVSIPVSAGATYQIGVVAYEWPLAFELQSSLRPQ